MAENDKLEVVAEDTVQKRGEEFIKEYGELVQKHKMDFATYPTFVPDGNGGFKVMVQTTAIDITNQPKKSPFVG